MLNEILKYMQTTFLLGAQKEDVEWKAVIINF